MKKFLAVVLFSVLVLGICVPSFALTNQEWAEIIGTGVGLVAGVVLPSIKGADGQPLVKDATQFQVAFYATMSGNLLGRMIGAFLPEREEIDGGIARAGLPRLDEDPTVFILYNETGFWRIEVGIDVAPREVDRANGNAIGPETATQFTILPGGAKWTSLSEGVEHKIKADAYLRTKQGVIKVFQWETDERVNLLGQGKSIRYRASR